METYDSTIAELQQRIENLEAENRKLRQFIRSRDLTVPSELTDPNKETQEFLETATLVDLNLLAHTYNVLQHGCQKLGRCRCRTLDLTMVRDLISYPLSEMFLLIGFGKKAAIDLILALDRHGLTMAEETSASGKRRTENICKEARKK